MAFPSVTYNFENGSPSDGDQVDTNFQDLINGASDGTKALSVAAGTFAGTLTANGAVNLGNGVTDEITTTGRWVSDLLPLTTGLYDLGSSSLAWAEIHGVAGTLTGDFTVRTNALFVNATGVGCGTITPDAPLTVDADLTSGTATIATLWSNKGSTDGTLLKILGTSTGTATSRRIDFRAVQDTDDSTAAELVFQGGGGNIRIEGNVGIGGNDFNEATLGIFMGNGASVSSTPTGGGILYADPSGNLKYKGPSGTSTTVAVA